MPSNAVVVGAGAGACAATGVANRQAAIVQSGHRNDGAADKDGFFSNV
jgi:hypothetical protein